MRQAIDAIRKARNSASTSANPLGHNAFDFALDQIVDALLDKLEADTTRRRSPAEPLAPVVTVECRCGSLDLDPTKHRRDCPYATWYLVMENAPPGGVPPLTG